MNINASALNVNHHKKLGSNLPGKNVEEEKKTKLSTNVDKDKDKDKKKLRKDEAYKVELSKQGKKKSDNIDLQHFNSLSKIENNDIENFDTSTENQALEAEKALEEKEKTTEEGTKKKTAEEEFTERLKDVLAKIRSGKNVAKKQEEWLNSELSALASKKYDLSKKLHLDRDDESILKALGDNIKQRQRIFNNLLQKIESTEGKNGFSLIEINNIMEQQQMEDDLKVMKESLKDKDDEEEDKEVKDKEKLEEEEEYTDQAEEVEEDVKEDPLRDEKRAAEIIDKNIDEIDSLKTQQHEEMLKSQKSDALLDSSYRYTKEILKNNEYSMEEKADALEEFNGRAFRYAFDREAYRNKAEYDAETVMLSRILLQQHDDLREVIKRNPYKVPVLDQDTVIQLLTH